MPLTVANVAADGGTVVLMTADVFRQSQKIWKGQGEEADKRKAMALLIAQLAVTGSLITLSVKGNIADLQNGRMLVLDVDENGVPVARNRAGTGETRQAAPPQREQVQPPQSSISESESIRQRVSNVFGQQAVNRLDASVLNSLNQLDDAALQRMQSRLQNISSEEVSQYLALISTDVGKGSRVLQFRTFDNFTNFERVFRAINLSELNQIVSVFDDAYLASLGELMRGRYEELLQDFATGNLAPNDPSFSERLLVLEEVKLIKNDVANQVPTQVYNDENLGGRNVAYASYRITLPDGRIIEENIVSISGRLPNSINGQLPTHRLGDRRIVPVVSKNDQRFEVIRRGANQDSERKILSYIVNRLEQEAGTRLDPLSRPYLGYSGEITIYSEMSPCSSCQSIIGEQFQDKFSNSIRINEVRYGVDFTEPQ